MQSSGSWGLLNVPATPSWATQQSDRAINCMADECEAGCRWEPHPATLSQPAAGLDPTHRPLHFPRSDAEAVRRGLLCAADRGDERARVHRFWHPHHPAHRVMGQAALAWPAVERGGLGWLGPKIPLPATSWPVTLHSIYCSQNGWERGSVPFGAPCSPQAGADPILIPSPLGTDFRRAVGWGGSQSSQTQGVGVTCPKGKA